MTYQETIEAILMDFGMNVFDVSKNIDIAKPSDLKTKKFIEQILTATKGIVPLEAQVTRDPQTGAPVGETSFLNEGHNNCRTAMLQAIEAKS